MEPPARRLVCIFGSCCLHLCEGHPGAMAQRGSRKPKPEIRHESNIHKPTDVRKQTVHTQAVDCD